jgi:hypothetical protein
MLAIFPCLSLIMIKLIRAKRQAMEDSLPESHAILSL